LHTWGQTLHHHPHLHCLVPAGGLALDGTAWAACPKRFFLPVRVLSRFFRRTFLTALRQAAAQDALSMQGQCQRWSTPAAWRQFLMSLQQMEWVVYAKPRWQVHIKYSSIWRAIPIAWPSPIGA